MIVLYADAEFRSCAEHLPLFDKQHLTRDARVNGKPQPANRRCDQLSEPNPLPFLNAWGTRRAKMHPNGNHHNVRRNSFYAAASRQRLPFADLAKRVNAALKRFPQILSTCLTYFRRSVFRRVS
jgi:hypothetical protein